MAKVARMMGGGLSYSFAQSKLLLSRYWPQQRTGWNAVWVSPRAVEFSSWLIRLVQSIWKMFLCAGNFLYLFQTGISSSLGKPFLAFPFFCHLDVVKIKIDCLERHREPWAFSPARYWELLNTSWLRELKFCINSGHCFQVACGCFRIQISVSTPLCLIVCII